MTTQSTGTVGPHFPTVPVAARARVPIVRERPASASASGSGRQNNGAAGQEERPAAPPRPRYTSGSRAWNEWDE